MFLNFRACSSKSIDKYRPTVSIGKMKKAYGLCDLKKGDELYITVRRPNGLLVEMIGVVNRLNANSVMIYNWNERVLGNSPKLGKSVQFELVTLKLVCQPLSSEAIAALSKEKKLSKYDSWCI